MSKSTRASSSTAAPGCSAKNDSSSRASVSALRSVQRPGIYVHSQCATEAAPDEITSPGDDRQLSAAQLAHVPDDGGCATRSAATPGPHALARSPGDGSRAARQPTPQ